MRKEILSLGEETLTLKSHETVCTRSDEITLQNQRDLGNFYNVVSGEQSSHTVEANKDGNSSSDTSAHVVAGSSFKDTFPQSLDRITERQTQLKTALSQGSQKKWMQWIPSWTRFCLYYFPIMVMMPKWGRS